MSESSVVDQNAVEPPAPSIELPWPSLAWSYRKQLAFGFILVLANRASGLSIPASMRFLVDDVLYKRDSTLLVPLIAVVLIAAVFQGITTYGIQRVLFVPAEKLVCNVRDRLQSHLAAVPISYIDGNKTGSFVSTVMTDVEQLRSIVGPDVVELLGGLTTCVFAACVLLHINAVLAAVTLVLIGCSGFIVYRRISAFRPLFRERSERYGDVTSAVTECLQGIRVTKIHRADSMSRTIFMKALHRLSECCLHMSDRACRTSITARCLMAVVAATVMYIGSQEVIGGHMTAGELVTFTAFLAVMAGPLLQAVSGASRVSAGLASVARLRGILQVKTEDGSKPRQQPIGPIKGSIRCDNIWFSYPGGPPVLTDISFESRPNTVTAIVGSSGSGKSTLMSLIASFYSPTRGAVRIDGVDLSTAQLESYRSQVGIVLQETFLFNRTIRDNIMVARPDADEADFRRACQLAHVDGFVSELPLRYDTVVGERGAKISGGQRQRIAIARALLADPPVLLLDEATSTLDARSEAVVQESLARLTRGRITFVITHRLSFIREADQILVLDRGRIVERGRHDELLRKHGRYFDLVSAADGVHGDVLVA